jgi:hypothetical protein
LKPISSHPSKRGRETVPCLSNGADQRQQRFETVSAPVLDRANGGSEHGSGRGLLECGFAEGPCVFTSNGQGVKMCRNPIVEGSLNILEIYLRGVQDNTPPLDQARSLVQMQTNDFRDYQIHRFIVRTTSANPPRHSIVSRSMTSRG